MKKDKATKSSVETKKAEYRRLIEEQRKLPLSEQWTMGDQIKYAKAAALVEIEEYENGIR